MYINQNILDLHSLHGLPGLSVSWAQEVTGLTNHWLKGYNHNFIIELYEMLTIILPFFLPTSFVSSNTLSFLPFISRCLPLPSPTGGSESGRSTPSLSTYSDGKSPSSTSTYVAAPRHFHVPGRPQAPGSAWSATYPFLCSFMLSVASAAIADEGKIQGKLWVQNQTSFL